MCVLGHQGKADTMAVSTQETQARGIHVSRGGRYDLGQDKLEGLCLEGALG